MPDTHAGPAADADVDAAVDAARAADADVAAWLGSSDAVIEAAAIAAALRTGMLDALGAERDAAAVARVCGGDRRGVELVLDVLVDAGVVERGRGYRLRDGGLGADEIRGRFDAVEHLVRTGRPVARVDAVADAQLAYPDVVGRIGRLVERVAHDLAVEHGRARPGPLRVLDVAAGAAPYSIAFARAGAEAVAVDLPGVLATTEASIAAAGVGDRVRTLAGDLFEIELDERFDVVVLAGFCRLVGPDRAAAAIGRCAGWLAPGGTLLIVDAVDTLDARRRGLARYALGLATRTGTGRPHAYSSYGAWLADVGLSGIELTTTDRPEISVISARLPEGART